MKTLTSSAVPIAARPQAVPVSPATPAEDVRRLLHHAATLGDIRRKEAERTSEFYRIVAFHPVYRRVWVQGPGQVPVAVHWDTLRCGCPDAARTLHGVETRLHHAGVPAQRILCKHVHMVTDIITRMVTDAGRDVCEFDDFLDALQEVAPDLPLMPAQWVVSETEVQA